ncbi:MAG: GNAT family N-acetyltransferase [Clostridiales bacterium]|nr:GNAT family N-acetyltransferase [Clostridiales bacterium]
MPDLLVKLYDLPPVYPLIEDLANKNIVIRKPIGPENYAVIGWIAKHFGRGWAGEAENSFFGDPKTIYIAVRMNEDGSSKMLGFGCYDATVKDFFGPTGVAEEERGQGIGKALLLACLHGLKDLGYGYGIIGDAGPVDFYRKCCGAVVIEDSHPGVYKGMLREEK